MQNKEIFYLIVFKKWQTREEYMVPFGHKRTELDKGKELFLKLFGFLVQPFRFLL